MAGLVHDLAHLIEVGIVVRQAAEEPAQGVHRRAPLVRGIEVIEPGLVGPGGQHRQPHAAALLDSVADEGDRPGLLPRHLVPRTALDRQATG